MTLVKTVATARSALLTNKNGFVVMKRHSPKFDGEAFFTEADWVGVLFRGGLGTEMKWLISVLTNLNGDHGGFSCKRLQLPNNDQLFWRDRDHPVDELVFLCSSDLDDPIGIMNLYYMNFANSSHYFEALDGSWRMHLPCDEQADGSEYKIWAGTQDSWRLLRPSLEALPADELPSSGPLSYAYSRSNVLIDPRELIPQEVRGGLGAVELAGSLGEGWN